MPQYELPDLDDAALEPHLAARIVELHHDQLEKHLAFHVSGHVLHSLLWKNLSPDGGGEPEGELAAFRPQFDQAAMGVQGSGWAALAREPVSGLLVVEQVSDHQGNLVHGAAPLLVHWPDVAARFAARFAV